MMHPRVSLHQVAFTGESTSEFLDHCRAIGIANAVLTAPTLRTEGVAEGPAGDPHIESINDVFETASFGQTLELAEQLSASSIYLITGGRDGRSWEEAAAQFVRDIAPHNTMAQAKDVSLLIENVPPLYADIHFAHTLTDTLYLAEAADVGICLELFSCWGEADLKALFCRAMSRIGLVQVSDYILGDRTYPCRAVPGDGVIPLERLIGDLLEAGYQGVFDIELVGPRIAAEGPRVATTRAAEYVSELLTRLGG